MTSLKNRGKVTKEIRQALYDELGAMAGQFTVSRRRSRDGDVIVVRLRSDRLIDESIRPSTWRGFPVEFVVARPFRAGV